MVKKLAVVMAAIAATLVALSPLASATPTGDGEDGPTIGDQNSPGAPKTGLINLDDVNALNGINVCPDVTATLGNVLGILGSGNAQTKGDRQITCDALSRK